MNCVRGSLVKINSSLTAANAVVALYDIPNVEYQLQIGSVFPNDLLLVLDHTVSMVKLFVCNGTSGWARTRCFETVQEL